VLFKSIAFPSINVKIFNYHSQRVIKMRLKLYNRELACHANHNQHIVEALQKKKGKEKIGRGYMCVCVLRKKRPMYVWYR